MKLDILKANALNGYATRIEYLERRPHIVAPVVILVEGVHHGTAGPIYYPAEELAKFPAAWNGVPIPVYHPSVDGEYVSCNHPEIIDDWVVGRLFNTWFDAELSGLRSEIWIDVERCEKVHSDTLKAVQQGLPLEVSTGLFFDTEGGSGIWREEEFETTARNFRPDHLALLPGSVGACSIADGCGVGANEEKGGKAMAGLSKLGRMVLQRLGLIDNDVSMEEKRNKLQGLVDALDKDVPGGRVMHYLIATYPEESAFVMRQEGPDGVKTFKGTYTVDGEGMPTGLSSDYQQVEERREFVPANEDAEKSGGEPPAPVKNREAKTTNKEDDMRQKEALVNLLISCGNTRWVEGDRDFLMGLEEGVLDKMRLSDDALAKLGATATADQGDTGADTGTTEPDAGDGEGTEDKDPSIEEYLSGAPEAIREVLAEGVKLHGEKRSALVQTVLKAAGNKFTEEQLSGKTTSELEAIASLVQAEPKEPQPTSNESGDGADGTGDSKIVPMPGTSMNIGRTAPAPSTDGGVVPLETPTVMSQVGGTKTEE